MLSDQRVPSSARVHGVARAFMRLGLLAHVYAGEILHVQAGAKLSLQYHERKDETSYLLHGRLVLTKGSTEDAMSTREVMPGDSWRNRPGELHTIEALEDADVLEVSTSHLDDVVRVRDQYGREGTNSP